MKADHILISGKEGDLTKLVQLVLLHIFEHLYHQTWDHDYPPKKICEWEIRPKSRGEIITPI
jgi:hypothetical protein